MIDKLAELKRGLRISVAIAAPLLVGAIANTPPIDAAEDFYLVSGKVFDDGNVNRIQDRDERGNPLEPGIPGVMVYADNTHLGPKTFTDKDGNWQLLLRTGLHSVEIAGAGFAGSIATTPEKVPVGWHPDPSTSYNFDFGVQRYGYDVTGKVIQGEKPVAGRPVYMDFPAGPSTVTSASGEFKFTRVGYDASNPSPFIFTPGGHHITVEGFDVPAKVNPQYPLIEYPLLFTKGSFTSQP